MLLDFSDQGLLKISGHDAQKLLQGQLTCDVEKLKAEEALFGAFCNPQGRVISLFHLFQLDGDYYLLMPRSLIALTITALKKYAIFYKVELTDVSQQHIIVGQEGSLSNEMEHQQNKIISFPHLVPIHLILNKIAPTVLSWREFKIKHNIPTVYIETSAKFLPHELNLPALNGVSFDKGCYTGQEIIARMQYKGKLKTHLYPAEIRSEIPPLPGAAIYAQKEPKQIVGTIVDACLKEYNNYRVLLITDESNAKNRHLSDSKGHFFTIL